MDRSKEKRRVETPSWSRRESKRRSQIHEIRGEAGGGGQDQGGMSFENTDTELPTNAGFYLRQQW
jgi:hypothetical protein